MTSTPSERDPLDRYYTRDAWARAIVSRWAGRLAAGHPACIVEPSVGRGAWSRALREAGYRGRIVGVDVDPDATGDGCDEIIRGDWLEVGRGVLERERPGLILGNPPYGTLDAHVAVMLASPAVVSLLVRTGWLQSARVQAMLSARPPTAIDLAAGRLAFDSPGVTRKTGDMHDYAQVTWGRAAPGGVCGVRWIHWKEPKKARKGKEGA